MSPKVRRVVRSVKYFFVFIILAAVVLCIVTLLSGESVVKLFMPMSEGGMLKEGAWWQMLLIFGAIAAVYPGLTFVKKEVMIEGDFEDHRDTIINAFEGLGYEKTDEDGEKLTFRLRNRFTRFMRAYEDGVTITKGTAPLILSGNRKDILRLINRHSHESSPQIRQRHIGQYLQGRPRGERHPRLRPRREPRMVHRRRQHRPHFRGSSGRRLPIRPRHGDSPFITYRRINHKPLNLTIMKLRTVHLAILLLTVIAGTLSSAAQEIQERTVNLLVKNGARFDHLIPNSMKYILPQFEECRLLTSYGEEYVGLVNANITTGTLNTISPEGDTVGVTISDCINRITASNRTIIKRDGKYLSVMLEHRDIALCIMPTLRIDMFAEADPTTEALYSIKDKVSLNTGSYTVIMYSGPTRPTYRDHSDMVTVRCKYTTQYVIAISEKIYPCKLSSFLKAFPKKKKAIREYTKLYYTDFTNDESLRMLFEYCAGLRY